VVLWRRILCGSFFWYSVDVGCITSVSVILTAFIFKAVFIRQIYRSLRIPPLESSIAMPMGSETENRHKIDRGNTAAYIYVETQPRNSIPTNRKPLRQPRTLYSGDSVYRTNPTHTQYVKVFIKGGGGEWIYRSTILNLGTRWRRVVGFTTRPLYSWRKSLPRTLWVGGWLGPTAGLDTVE
jgi:hypothetical protein